MESATGPSRPLGNDATYSSYEVEGIAETYDLQIAHHLPKVFWMAYSKNCRLPYDTLVAVHGRAPIRHDVLERLQSNSIWAEACKFVDHSFQVWTILSAMMHDMPCGLTAEPLQLCHWFLANIILSGGGHPRVLLNTLWSWVADSRPPSIIAVEV